MRQPLPFRSVLLAIAAHTGMWAYAITLSAMGALLPAMATDFKFDASQGKVFFLWYGIGFLLGLPFVHSKPMRGRANRMFMAGALGIMLSHLFWTQGKSFDYLSAAFFSLGFLGSWFEVGINSWVGKEFSHGKASALNLLHGSFGIGAWIGPKGMEWWLGRGGEWVWCLLPATLLMALALLVAQFGGNTKDNAESRQILAAKGANTPFNFPWLPALVVFSYIGAEMTLSNWAPTAFKEIWGYSDAKSAGSVGNFWLLMGLGRFGCSFLSHYFNSRTLLLWTGVLSTGSLLGLTLAPSGAFAQNALALTGLFYSGALALAMAIAQEENPDNLEKATTICGFALGLGLLLGPPVAGQAADWFDLKAVLYCSFGLNLVYLLGSGLIAWRGSKKVVKTP